MTLEPGDVVITGTPAGVGKLAPGDTYAITVEGVGDTDESVCRRRLRVTRIK